MAVPDGMGGFKSIFTSLKPANLVLSMKGNPSKFFKMELDDQEKAQPNTEQKQFVSIHYPEFADPEDMVNIINQLYTVACRSEKVKQLLAQKTSSHPFTTIEAMFDPND